MQKPAGNAGLWGISPYLPVSTWLLRSIAHDRASLAMERSLLVISPPLLPSNPKLRGPASIHQLFWRFKATRIAQPGFWQKQASSSSLYCPTRLFFASPSERAAAEALQVGLLRGAVVRRCLTAPDPGTLGERCAAMGTAQHQSSR